MEPNNHREVGNTEQSWCRAVSGGTGTAVLAILLSKFPGISRLEDVLHKLQNRHPILRSRLHSDTAKKAFAFVTAPTPFVKVVSINLSSTLKIIEKFSNPTNQSISHFHLILEHELNQNIWCSDANVQDMLFATTYALPDEKWLVVLRLHVSACDRTTAVGLLKELLALAAEEDRGRQIEVLGRKGEVSLGIEDLIPDGKAKKPMWLRAKNMLGYSVTSLRQSNLKFIDPRSPRSSQVVRLKLNRGDTQRVLGECKSRGLKLCGAVTAAGLIAAQSCRSGDRQVDKQRKYAVVTLTDCRSILDTPLSEHNFGFYHSAILNTHAMKGGEQMWELATKVYKSFMDYKNSDRHFSDMSDLNFLMCRAIENPALTPSSSLRTSLLSVFEDTVIDDSDDKKKVVGLEDYMGCASVHGLGPSVAIFDTIRDGQLDCTCVYPSPLHSRDQMVEFVSSMKSALLGGGREGN